jgi:hypothetical protein
LTEAYKATEEAKPAVNRGHWLGSPYRLGWIGILVLLFII